MMRRTTLGTLNIGNQSRPVARERKTSLGARSSVGSRLSTGRPSLARSVNGRRPSSQYGRENCVQVKDPRSLSDRGYQQKMIRFLMEFLTEFNYPHQISVRILSAPSMKEFGNIFQFLYKFIKPAAQSTSLVPSKLTEEVPKLFKMLRYPFNISKSNLSSVGSPHAWPIMLGALCWLIELIRDAVSITEDIEGLVLFPEDNYRDEDQEEGTQLENKYFFSYLEKSYSAFMHGQELDELGDFDKEFIDNIRSRNAGLLDGMENLIAENDTLEKELTALQSDSLQLETLCEQKITLTSDREKFISYLGDLERHRHQLQEVNTQLVDEQDGLRMEQEALTQENAMLQHTLSNQELSAADVERMKHEKRDLQKTVEQLEKDRDYFDQQIWEKEMQFAKKHEEIERHTREYNEIARKLKLIPMSADHAGGIDFEMHYYPHSQRPDQRVHMDFRATIKPALLRFKHEISEKIRTIESQAITEEEAFDQLSDMVSDKQQEIVALETKIQTVDKDLDWKKEMMAKEHQKTTGDSQCLDEGVQHMKMTLLKCQEAVEQNEKELRELKLRMEKDATDREQEKEEYSDLVLTACHMIMEHKTLIQNRVMELHEQAEIILQQTRESEVPRSTIVLSEESDE